MSNRQASLPHEERTATEPRESQLHRVAISRVTEVNEEIRTFRLSIDDRHGGIDFLPGQWLDVHFAGLERAGGYTITSSPKHAIAQAEDSEAPFVELAVQHASTPQVQRLWASQSEVLNMQLHVRVGGSFTWPPSGVNMANINRVLFLAGGVGINPLISMVSHMHETNSMPARVDFLYATKVRSSHGVDNVLSLGRLLAITATRRGQFRLHLRCSGHPSRVLMETAEPRTSFEPRRLLESDVIELLGVPTRRAELLCYICGPPPMTDYLVDMVRREEGILSGQVLCEKWW